MDEFLLGMVGSSRLEWIGAFTGFVAVVLTIRRSVWSYLFGIPCVIIYAHLFIEWQLYSQAILYAYYIVMLFLGFHWWRTHQDSEGLVILERTKFAALAPLVIVTGGLVYGLGWVMDTQTDARLPYLDAATTVIAGFAQYLQSRRRVETYYVWTVVNLLSIALFYFSGNPPTMALYAIYLALSVWGIAAWTRAWREKSGAEALL
ncbi:MAG: nicotinamide riboside transporter PnuC [Paracoccaceae bacterium]